MALLITILAMCVSCLCIMAATTKLQTRFVQNTEGTSSIADEGQGKAIAVMLKNLETVQDMPPYWSDDHGFGETAAMGLLDKTRRRSEKDPPLVSTRAFDILNGRKGYRWRIVGAFVLLALQSVLILSLLISIRQRQRAEASLRNVTGRLLAAQDEERRRIARELHDGAGQHLSSIALAIGQALGEFPDGHVRLRLLLQDAQETSRRASEEIRTSSYLLHSHSLDGSDLTTSVRGYLGGLERRTKLHISFDAPADLANLDAEAGTTLFRIVQESATNAIRHAGARNIRVQLRNLTTGVTLIIADDGHGMTKEQLSRAKGTATLGVGIAGMRERIKQLDGSFQIQSDSKGTRVAVEVPFHEERYAAHLIGRRPRPYAVRPSLLAGKTDGLASLL